MAKNKNAGGGSNNTSMRLAYDDLRTWLAEADRLGELPVIQAAFTRGELSYGKVSTLTGAAP